MSALHTMSRTRRRWLVLTMQLGMAAYALAFSFAGINAWWLFLLVMCLQAVYTIIFFRVLRPVMKEVVKEAEDLDERQIALRDRAHYDAYQILGTVVCMVTALPMAAFVYAGFSLPLSLTQWHLLGLFFFFANLIVSLPASVVAWTEPDPEPDEEPADRTRRPVSTPRP